MVTLNRLRKPPNASTREMCAYMGAILEVTGMMSGQGFPLPLFMDNFRTHLTPKAQFQYATLEQRPDGLFYITSEGWRFFASRLTNRPVIPGRQVSRAEIVEMARRILASHPEDDWEAFDVTFPRDA